MPSARNSRITKFIFAATIRNPAVPADIATSMKTNHNSMLLWCGAAVFLMVIGTGAVVAAGTAIGMAVAHGSFQVDRAAVRGSSSLFEGSTVETAVTASEIQVEGSAAVRLAADSRVRVYRSRMVLEEGFTEVRRAAGYTVEARSLTIAPQVHDAVARIRLEGARKVTVAALGGPVEVRNSSGVLVARMGAGMSLDFEPQAAGSAAANGGTQTGASGATGSGAQAGANTGGAPGSAGGAGVQAGTGTGAAAGSGAGAPGGGAAGASAAGAGAATGAAAGAGIGVGTIAVIGGVAVAATVGGLAATGSLPGQSSSAPSASR